MQWLVIMNLVKPKYHTESWPHHKTRTQGGSWVVIESIVEEEKEMIGSFFGLNHKFMSSTNYAPGDRWVCGRFVQSTKAKPSPTHRGVPGRIMHPIALPRSPTRLSLGAGNGRQAELGWLKNI